MQISTRHRRYWHWNVALTTLLLAAWSIVTFVPGYYAVALNQYSFLDFPLGFYTFAQGALIAYLLIILVYIKAMNWLDKRFGVAERR
jgi:putative solute:sodium symporter small subunit